MGRGGYSLKIKKMRKAAIEAGQKEAEDPQWKPDREDVYIAGHTLASGKPTEILQHVIDTMVSIYSNNYMFVIPNTWYFR